ncbi:hypothetical protein GBF38_022620 [Nibea albiflora]|uniref:Uncharacterized protein n=1 Tax=Nibea albiflora TaxID=240163 RepID=A0ACB7EXG8_NIBAL|nr:hypothetical protein GBF38_022620 [Nibea albiflora]
MKNRRKRKRSGASCKILNEEKRRNTEDGALTGLCHDTTLGFLNATLPPSAFLSSSPPPLLISPPPPLLSPPRRFHERSCSVRGGQTCEEEEAAPDKTDSFFAEHCGHIGHAHLRLYGDVR